MTASEQTFTILKTRIKESLSEQINLQSMDIDEVLEQSSDIKELAEALNDTVDNELLTYSNS